MSALATVADYKAAARVLLQDTVAPYRYPDADLLNALNFGLLEIRRIRPDLMWATLDATTPAYTSDSDSVVLNEMYRMALVYFICGLAQMRDEEETQDSRSAAFMTRFAAQMTGGLS